MLRRLFNFILGLIIIISFSDIDCANVQPRSDLECEFPPKFEEDLTHLRRKRLTTDNGLVCLEDYPYTVSVRLHGKHWCGGALIDRQWVLTAAQCFDYVTKEEVTVRVGSVFRDFGGKILAAKEIARHPEYKMNQYYPEHNLAMVKLNLAVALSSRVRPVSLPPPLGDVPRSYGHVVVTGYGSFQGGSYPPGPGYAHAVDVSLPLLLGYLPHSYGHIVVMGYGSTSGQIREGENQELRRMIVQDVTRGSCRLLYGNDYRLQADHMCLQSTVKGIALCAGDTGDPAVHFSGVSAGGTLYGIALFSGTEECSYKAKPGVYAKVSHSRAWLDSILLSASPLNSDQTESRESGDNLIPLHDQYQ